MIQSKVLELNALALGTERGLGDHFHPNRLALPLALMDLPFTR